MAASIDDVPAADIAVAINEVERMERTYCAVQGAKAVLNVLANRKQICADLDTAVAKRRAELADLEKVTVEQFKAQGEAEAKRLIAAAEAKAHLIVRDAKVRADEADTMAATKRAELAALNAQLAEIRKSAAALAG